VHAQGPAGQDAVASELATVATTGSYEDLTNKPIIPSLTGYATETWVENKGYLINETDPTVPSWAKAANKPSYSYSEITGTPTIPTVPTSLSSFTDDLGTSPTHTHNQYLTAVPNTCVTSTTTGLKIEIVSSMPASPDSNTIYIVQ